VSCTAHAPDKRPGTSVTSPVLQGRLGIISVLSAACCPVVTWSYITNTVAVPCSGRQLPLRTATNSIAPQCTMDSSDVCMPPADLLPPNCWHPVCLPTQCSADNSIAEHCYRPYCVAVCCVLLCAISCSAGALHRAVLWCVPPGAQQRLCTGSNPLLHILITCHIGELTSMIADLG
jgi:hypothetical protein